MKPSSLRVYYPLGKELIDSQHKVLQAYLSRVYRRLRAGENCYGLLENLDAYLKLHFRDEERVMDECRLQSLNHHITQHALLVRHLELAIGECRDTTSSRGMDELLVLKKLFREHMREFEREHAECMGEPRPAPIAA